MEKYAGAGAGTGVVAGAEIMDTGGVGAAALVV